MPGAARTWLLVALAAGAFACLGWAWVLPMAGEAPEAVALGAPLATVAFFVAVVGAGVATGRRPTSPPWARRTAIAGGLLFAVGLFALAMAWNLDRNNPGLQDLRTLFTFAWTGLFATVAGLMLVATAAWGAGKVRSQTL